MANLATGQTEHQEKMVLGFVFQITGMDGKDFYDDLDSVLDSRADTVAGHLRDAIYNVQERLAAADCRAKVLIDCEGLVELKVTLPKPLVLSATDPREYSRVGNEVMRYFSDEHHLALRKQHEKGWVLYATLSRLRTQDRTARQLTTSKAGAGFRWKTGARKA